MGNDPEYQRRYQEANREKIRQQRQRYREANRAALAAKQREYYEANKEKVAESKKRYSESNADKIREYKRAWREANLEERREYDRRYYEANSDRLKDYHRKWRATNRDKLRLNRRDYYVANREEIMRRSVEWYWANRERALGQHRDYRIATGYKKPRERARDRLVKQLWQEQGGRCYLCEEQVELAACVIEHDHRCCSKQNTFCSKCTRGVSCQPCNKIIAFARDNVERLRKIADNLEPQLTAVTNRMSEASEQRASDAA